MDQHKNWVAGVLLVFFIAFPTAAVVQGKLAAAGVLAAVGFAGLLFTRLDDIAKIKAFGLEAELRAKILEANATLEQLRELAVVLSAPILDQLAMHGQIFRQMKFSDLHDGREKIISSLRRIGVPPAQIDRASELWRAALLMRLLNLLAFRIEKISPDVGKEFATFRVSEDHAPAPGEVESFCRKHGLTDPELTDLLIDYSQAFESGRARRPEIFPIGQSL